jgi:hypothetical protein
MTDSAKGTTKTIIAWLNQSQPSPAGAKALSDDDSRRIVEALNLQNQHVVAAWGDEKQVQHVFAQDIDSLPTGATRAYFLYNTDQASAAGYHAVDPDGQPYIRVFVETILQAPGGSILTGNASVSACAGHEADEYSVDPTCRLSASAPTGDVWALEVADPVEANCYEVSVADGTRVTVSDFVYPSFFRTNGEAPFDHCDVLKGSFTVAPGGYGIINGQPMYASESGLTPDAEAAGYPAWRLSMKAAAPSRTARHILAGRLAQAEPLAPGTRLYGPTVTTTLYDPNHSVVWIDVTSHGTGSHDRHVYLYETQPMPDPIVSIIEIPSVRPGSHVVTVYASGWYLDEHSTYLD